MDGDGVYLDGDGSQQSAVGRVERQAAERKGQLWFLIFRNKNSQNLMFDVCEFGVLPYGTGLTETTPAQNQNRLARKRS